MAYGRTPIFGNAQPIEPRASDPDPAAPELAMNVWLARRLMKLNPEVEPKVRGTVRGLVGSGLSEEDITELENRAIKAAEPSDLGVLSGLLASIPVYLDPKQESVVERIVGALGDDDRGRRAQDAYRRARVDGRIRRAR